MNITKRELVAAGLRSRGQAFDDAADHLLAALLTGFDDNPAEIAAQLRSIARNCIAEGNELLEGKGAVSGLPTYLPGR